MKYAMWLGREAEEFEPITSLYKKGELIWVKYGRRDTWKARKYAQQLTCGTVMCVTNTSIGKSFCSWKYHKPLTPTEKGEG